MLQMPFLRYAGGLLILVLGFVAAPAELVAAVLIRPHLFETFFMPVDSMAPALVRNDRFLCHKRLAPKRWSIVVFAPPTAQDQLYALRVIALPGETVEIGGDGQIKINDVVSPAPPGAGPYVSIDVTGRPFPNRGVAGRPITLGADEYYLLGDNSAIAGDSRVWHIAHDGCQLGAVPRDKIKGVVTYVYWPPARWKSFN